MNTVDNKTEIEKALAWWYDSNKLAERWALSEKYFPNNNHPKKIKDEHVVEIWRKETNQSAPTNTDRELKCTPGEWAVKEYGITKSQVFALMDGPAICSLYGSNTDPEVVANAHLIAGSKDLYNALRNLYRVSALASESHIFKPELEAAELALQKANPNYNVTQ